MAENIEAKIPEPKVEQPPAPVPKKKSNKLVIPAPADGKMKKEFTPEERQAIYNARMTGKTPKELAEIYHTQIFRIHKVLNVIQNELPKGERSLGKKRGIKKKKKIEESIDEVDTKSNPSESQ